jgi:hypothetical protein
VRRSDLVRRIRTGGIAAAGFRSARSDNNERRT